MSLSDYDVRMIVFFSKAKEIASGAEPYYDYPEYEKLYYKPDMENDGKGDIEPTKDGFIWSREKSNENLEKHHHSFYFARLMALDPFKYKLGPASTPGFSEYLGVLPGSKDEMFLNVEMKQEDKFIRIISSYVRNNDREIERYLARKQTIRRQGRLYPEGFKRIMGRDSKGGWDILKDADPNFWMEDPYWMKDRIRDLEDKGIDCTKLREKFSYLFGNGSISEYFYKDPVYLKRKKEWEKQTGEIIKW
jgi:uncharacterized DUF497 family protein